MEIIKTVTSTYVIKDIAVDFFTYSERFRQIRSGAKYKGSSCFNCCHKFNDGDKMSLVLFKNYPNRLVCRKCAENIDETLKKERG